MENLPDGTYSLHHHRIDATHSNAHTVWTEQGSPQNPTAEQLAAVKARQGLEELEPARDVTVSGGTFSATVELPLPSVSLLVLEPR